MSKLGAWGMWIMKALGRTSSSYSWGHSSSPYHQSSVAPRWHCPATSPQHPAPPRCQEPLTHLCIQLHDVGHFVPAEAHEPLVIPGAVSPHYNVRLEVWLPRHSVGHSGRPPFGVVCWGVALWPHVVPAGRDGNERLRQQRMLGL